MSAAPGHELVLEKTLEAPRANVWRCWTEPDLLRQWFVPRPWTTPRVDVDVRPGGRMFFVMADPDGNETPNEGVFLDVVPGEKLVFTDAFSAGWIPTAKPFMVAEVLFRDAGPGRTLYTATARHWTAEDRETHEKMGFHEGWSAAAAQLTELASGL